MRRCCRWWAEDRRWRAWPGGRCPGWTSCVCTRARCGAGTGPSTIRRRRPPARRVARAAGGAHGGGHGGQRGLLLGLTLGLAPEIPAAAARLHLRAGPAQLLPGRPPRPGGELLWPGEVSRRVGPVGAAALCLRLLPLAEQGPGDRGGRGGGGGELAGDVVASGAQTGQTGAVWQRRPSSAPWAWLARRGRRPGGGRLPRDVRARGRPAGTRVGAWLIPTVRVREHRPGPACRPTSRASSTSCAGPALIEVPGRRARPGRVVAGLCTATSHLGCGPSTAICASWGRIVAGPGHRLLPGRGGGGPAAPRLTRRRLPQGRDLNRCFRPPFHGREGASSPRPRWSMLRAASARGGARSAQQQRPQPGLRGGDGPRRSPPGADRPVRPAGDALELRLGTFTEAWEGVAPAVTIEAARPVPPRPTPPPTPGCCVSWAAHPRPAPAGRPHGGVRLAGAGEAARPGWGWPSPTSGWWGGRHPRSRSRRAQLPDGGRRPGTGLLSDEAATGPWPFEAHDESGRECSREYLRDRRPG